MAESFNIGRKGKFGNIDLSKLASGIKKDDIAGNNEFFKSLFDKFDKEQDGVLSRSELDAMIEAFKKLVGDDTELKVSEAKDIDLGNGKKVTRKDAKQIFAFLNKLASTTEGVKNVEVNNGVEIIEHENGQREERYQDGSIKTIEANGDYVLVDKNGTKLEEKIVKVGKTTEIKYENGKKVTEKITEDGKETVINYENEKEIKRVVTTENQVVTTSLVQGFSVKKVEDKSTGVIETFIDDKLIERRDPKNNTVIAYRDDSITTTVEKDNKKDVTVRNLEGNLLSEKLTEKLENDSVKITDTQYKGEDYTKVISIDGCNISQTKKVGEKTYSVAYDGNGNTVVVVQNSETIAALAKKFGCTEQEIIDANPDKKVGGQGNNRYFYAGEEVKIPREIEADNKYLQNRKSADEVKNDYRAWAAKQERIRAEEDAKAAAEAAKKAEAEEALRAEENRKVQLESAKTIVEDLKKATKGYNNKGRIKEILARIDNSTELAEVNRLLAKAGYEADDLLYSSLEKFINHELQRAENDWSCEELETFVQDWLNKGYIEGEEAISAQARLAARVIIDGGDGFGTDPDRIKQGIYMIKAPANQGPDAAKKVYAEVNKIIANHNTFYGIGSKSKDLTDYLEGELYDAEIKYINSMLAETNALQDNDRVQATYDLIIEAVEGGGTNVDELKQALKGIKDPEERLELEKKLGEYCNQKNIKDLIDGQDALQAILYDELTKDEVHKFNEMMIEQGAYTQEEIKKLRAEQAAIEILNGGFGKIKTAVCEIKDKAVLDKLNELIKTKGYADLNEFLSKKLDATDAELVKAELAANNVLENYEAAKVAFNLLLNEDFDVRAAGMKAIRNEEVAKLVNEKLQKDGSSLKAVLEQFDAEKIEYRNKAKIWSWISDTVADAYKENTDASTGLYVETNAAQVELTSEQKQAYDMTVKILEEQIEQLKKAYQEALDSQGALSWAVNDFCERLNIGTTREDIQARLEHDTETLRLIKLAADGKLAKMEDGVAKAVNFEEIFNIRQTEVNPKKTIEFDAEKIANVDNQGYRMALMNTTKDIVSTSWEELDSAAASNDEKRMATVIYDVLNKLHRLSGNEMNLSQFGYSLNSEGIIVDSNGQNVPANELKELITKLKRGLAEISKSVIGQDIDLNAKASDVKESLGEATENAIEAFKQEYKEAFGQLPTDEMIDKYISTINTGTSIVNIGVTIGAAIVATVAAPFSGGTSLALFVGAVTAGTSMGMSALEHSTDAYGYTNLEWTSDFEQAIWDGALAACGMKVGMYAEKFVQGGTKVAQSILTKNKNFLSKLISNPETLEKSAVCLARAEALGFEVSSDTVQSLVQMYCQEGKFNEEMFVRGLIMSVAGNALGHVASAKNDIKDISANAADDNILHNATNQGTAPTGGKFSEDKLNNVKDQTRKIAQDGSPDAVVQAHAEADLHGIQSRAQARELKNIISDEVRYVNVGKERIDIATADEAALARAKKQVESWADGTRNKQEILDLINSRYVEVDTPATPSAQKVITDPVPTRSTAVVDGLNAHDAQTAGAILNGRKGALSPHDAATLESHLINNLKSADDIDSFIAQIRERVGVDSQGRMHVYEIQGVDHAANLIKKAELKKAKIVAQQTKMNNATNILDKAIESGKGLNGNEVSGLRAFIAGSDSIEDLTALSQKLSQVKKSGSIRTLQKDIATRIEMLKTPAKNSVPVTPAVKQAAEADVPAVAPKADVAETPAKAADAPAKADATPAKAADAADDVDIQAARKAQRNDRAIKLRALRRKMGNKLANLYVSIEKQIANLKTLVDFNKIKETILTKFSKYTTEMQELMRKLYDRCRKVGIYPEGSKLPKGSSVKLSGNETLKLADYELDLSSPSVRTKLEALKDGESITVGITGDIKIPEEFKYVSSNHLSIKKVGNSFIVTDRSLNGTTIGKNISHVSDQIKETFGRTTVKDIANLEKGAVIEISKGDIVYTIRNIDGTIKIVKTGKLNDYSKAIPFDKIQMSSRTPAGEMNPGKSMDELLTPSQKQVYIDSYSAFQRSKNRSIKHNHSNTINENNLLHGTGIQALLGDNGILSKGLVPREISGNSAAQIGGRVPDTLTPLCTDVWDVRSNSSIGEYFDANHPHWKKGISPEGAGGEFNFLPKSDILDGGSVVIVLDKSAMDTKILNNSFEVNQRGRSILFENGNMSRGHNYPTHRAIPIGAPANSIEKIIVDTRKVFPEQISQLKAKIHSQGLDIALYDMNGNLI